MLLHRLKQCLTLVSVLLLTMSSVVKAPPMPAAQPAGSLADQMRQVEEMAKDPKFMQEMERMINSIPPEELEKLMEAELKKYSPEELELIEQTGKKIQQQAMQQQPPAMRQPPAHFEPPKPVEAAKPIAPTKPLVAQKPTDQKEQEPARPDFIKQLHTDITLIVYHLESLLNKSIQDEQVYQRTHALWGNMLGLLHYLKVLAKPEHTERLTQASYQGVIDLLRQLAQTLARSEPRVEIAEATEHEATPWEVIGVPEGASTNQIKTAHRNLANKFNPEQITVGSEHEDDIIAAQRLARVQLHRIETAYKAINTKKKREQLKREHQALHAEATQKRAKTFKVLDRIMKALNEAIFERGIESTLETFLQQFEPQELAEAQARKTAQEKQLEEQKRMAFIEPMPSMYAGGDELTYPSGIGGTEFGGGGYTPSFVPASDFSRGRGGGLERPAETLKGGGGGGAQGTGAVQTAPVRGAPSSGKKEKSKYEQKAAAIDSRTPEQILEEMISQYATMESTLASDAGKAFIKRLSAAEPETKEPTRKEKTEAQKNPLEQPNQPETKTQPEGEAPEEFLNAPWFEAEAERLEEEAQDAERAGKKEEADVKRAEAQKVRKELEERQIKQQTKEPEKPEKKPGEKEPERPTKKVTTPGATLTDVEIKAFDEQAKISALAQNSEILKKLLRALRLAPLKEKDAERRMGLGDKLVSAVEKPSTQRAALVKALAETKLQSAKGVQNMLASLQTFEQNFADLKQLFSAAPTIEKPKEQKEVEMPKREIPTKEKEQSSTKA